MCVIYMLFHNCKHSRIRKLSGRNTRNVIKAWWAFWIQLSVQGCAWVKGKPNWKKKKHPAKSNFIISSKWFYDLYIPLLHVTGLVVGFFCCVYHQHKKFKSILLKAEVGCSVVLALTPVKSQPNLPWHIFTVIPSISGKIYLNASAYTYNFTTWLQF